MVSPASGLPLGSAALIEAASTPASAGRTRQTSSIDPISQRVIGKLQSPSDKDQEGPEFRLASACRCILPVLGESPRKTGLLLDFDIGVLDDLGPARNL